MKKKAMVILFLAALFWISAGAAGLGAAPDKLSQKTVYVIPVKGTVEPGMAAYIKRALESIKDKKDAAVVFQMDTFGGRVDAALDIVDTISNISDLETIAFVEKRAISAGALIALSNSRLFMKKSTIIGDCAPIIKTQEGQKMAGEKIQTVLRAKFRALAKKNNYPVVLSESMVTVDMEVYEVMMGNKKTYMDKISYDDLTKKEKKNIKSKKTIVAKGELLTMDDEEAFDLGFSTKSVENLEQVLSLMGYADTRVVKIAESWSESFVRFLQPFLPVLMLLGIGALYTEIKAPGFGFPGVFGILCLGLVFFNQYLVGLANYSELLIFLIGFLLLGVEVFVLPGFGIAGISALIVIAAGLVLSFQGFVLPDPELPWEGALLMRNLVHVMGAFLLAFLASLFMVRFVLPRFSKVVSGPYLDATLEDSHVGRFQNQTLGAGDTGIAHTFLRPSGKIMINNRKIDAITQGQFIEKGTVVVIEKIEPNRVIVRPADV